MDEIPDRPNDRDGLPKAIGRPATNALAAAGIDRLEQLVTWTEHDLLELHGVGPKAVRILGETLAASGRRFADR